MKNLHEVETDSKFWDRKYSINIKLDYSAFIVEYTDLGALKFYARNYKPITEFNILNRFAILSPAINIVKINKDKMFSVPGFYHFEYKNPNMVYGIDHRESGLYFSYFVDYEKIIRRIELKSEVLVEIPLCELTNKTPDEILATNNLASEEGLVIHFYDTNESYKVVNSYFTNIAKLKRSVQNNTRELRNIIKEIFIKDEDVILKAVNICIKEDRVENCKVFFFNVACVIFSDFMRDLNRDFFKYNSNLTSYLELMRFYDVDTYENIITAPQLISYDKILGTNHYEALAFCYIVIVGLVEKNIKSPQIEIR